MRVLAHIHTYNEARFIEQALAALQQQTRQLDAIVIVDNASTDGTVDKAFPENVTVIRNSTDLGTSGATNVGLADALEKGFDWTWVLDADSVLSPTRSRICSAFSSACHPRKWSKSASWLAGWPTAPARWNTGRSC
jgi:rhamnopyranosyl-N-acetylglucosaminyl-diphospho-decaprenol beta-1,3/1,4-galactofuranosyltransferase